METPAANPSPVARAAGWLLPSWTQWLWLALLLAMLTPAHRTLMVSGDGDACMHWTLGEWMLRHGQFVRSDHWTHTRPGEPMVTKEWLAQVLLAVGGRMDGLFGLAAVAALVIATTFALLHRRLVREGNDLLAATAVTLLAALAGTIHWLARPHVFTFLMVLLWHDALRRFERDGGARRLVVALAGLMLLWVQLHGAYFAGFALLGAYAAGAALEWLLARDVLARSTAARKLGVLAGAGLLCGAVSLVNPNGWQLHAHNLRLLGSEFLTGALIEHRSINFNDPDAIGCMAWLALVFFALALRRPRVTVSEGLTLLLWTGFALRSVRHMPLLAIISAPIIAPAISSAVRGRLAAFSERMRTQNAASRGWPVVAALALGAVALMPRATEMPRDKWPVDAARYVSRHREQFAGNMLNLHLWGGWLMVALPEHKVFVNGMADFFGERFMREFCAACDLAPGWTDLLERHNVTWTLFPPNHPVSQALGLSAGWRRVYADGVAAIYKRTP